MVLDLSELKKPETTEWRFRECNGNFLAYRQGKEIDMKSVKRDVLVSDPEREIVRVRHGADSPKDGDLSMVSIFDAKTDSMLMRWYEKTIAYDCDGVLAPTLKTFRVGPAEYYNPDGTVAGLEFYDESFDLFYRDGRVLSDPDRLTHVYFHPEGGYMSRDAFDLRYSAVLESMGLKTVGSDGVPMKFEFCPRMHTHNSFVRDILIEITVGGDRFGPKDIHDFYLDGKSPAFRNGLADDIMRRFKAIPGHERMGSDEFIRRGADAFVSFHPDEGAGIRHRYNGIEQYSEGEFRARDVVMLSSDVFWVRYDDLSAGLSTSRGEKVAAEFDDFDFVTDFRLVGNLKGREYFAYSACDFPRPKDACFGLLDCRGKKKFIEGLDYSSIDAFCESFDSLVRKVQTLERLESGQGNGRSCKL